MYLVLLQKYKKKRLPFFLSFDWSIVLLHVRFFPFSLVKL